MFSVDRQEKSQSLGPPFQWETRQASFPTGKVNRRVGVFLSPLNTNDGLCLFLFHWTTQYEEYPRINWK